jgi:predicted RNA binding protein YcfA (HicA-like mRNA interferase family)
MTRRPRLRGVELIAALRKAGFEVNRVRGSHHFLRHPDGRTTVVPVPGLVPGQSLPGGAEEDRVAGVGVTGRPEPPEVRHDGVYERDRPRPRPVFLRGLLGDVRGA